MDCNFSPSIRFVQQNLSRSRVTTSEFCQELIRTRTDVALVCEPYTQQGVIPAIPGYKIFQFPSTERVKAAVVVSDSVSDVIGLTQFSTSNLAIVSFSIAHRTVYVCSAYVEPRQDTYNTLQALGNFLGAYAQASVLVAGDFMAITRLGVRLMSVRGVPPLLTLLRNLICRSLTLARIPRLKLPLMGASAPQ